MAGLVLTRRGFLKGLLAAAVAPAIVKYANLMKPRSLEDCTYVIEETVKAFSVPRITPLQLMSLQPHPDNYVDVTTICSNAKEFEMGLRSNLVDAELLATNWPENLPAGGHLLCNGELVIQGYSVGIYEQETARIKIYNMDSAMFELKNRQKLPEFTWEFKELNNDA